MATRSTSAASPPSALLPSRGALAGLLDGVAEPLLLFDDLGRLSFCNREAMRLLGAEPGLSVAQLEAALGAEAVSWLRDLLLDAGVGEAQLRSTLADARAVLLSCWRVGRVPPAWWRS